MKTDRVYILAVLFLWSVVTAPAGFFFGQNQSAGGATPTLLYDGYNASTGTWADASGQPGEERVQFSVATTITKVSVYIDNAGADTPNSDAITCYVYDGTSSDDLSPASGGGALLFTSTNTVTHSSLTSGKVSYDFNIPGTSQAASTKYHIVFKQNSYSANHFNLYHTNNTSTIPSPAQLSLWNTGGVNQNAGSFPGYDLQIRIYGTQP